MRRNFWHAGQWRSYCALTVLVKFIWGVIVWNHTCLTHSLTGEVKTQTRHLRTHSSSLNYSFLDASNLKPLASASISYRALQTLHLKRLTQDPRSKISHLHLCKSLISISKTPFYKPKVLQPQASGWEPQILCLQTETINQIFFVLVFMRPIQLNVATVWF